MIDIIQRLRNDMAGAKHNRIKALATDMGVSEHTLLKVIRGETRSPRYEFVKAVMSYYDRLPIAPLHMPK